MLRASRAALPGLAFALLAAGCGGGSDAGDTASRASLDEIAPLPDAVAADVTQGGRITDAVTLGLRRNPKPAPVPPAPAPAPAPATEASCGLPDFQASVLARLNQYRASGASCRTAGQFAAAQPLQWNSKLDQAAAAHSADMAAQNYFSHTSKDGRTMVDRINATEYTWSTIGENIAAGYTTVNQVVDGWMASDGHCANIMNPAYRDVAVACVASTTSTYRSYWTMDAGRPR